MSGAEALAVIGILANVAELVGASIAIVSRVAQFCHDIKELPKALRDVKRRLPLLSVALEKRQNKDFIAGLSETERKILLDLLQHIQAETQKLERILNDLFPAKDASTLRKSLKALASFRQESKIEEIMNGIEKDMQWLKWNDFHPVTQTPFLPGNMSAVEDSPPKKTHFMVGISGDDEFIGREDLMKRVTEKLSTEGTHNRLALVALGGMGKTRIAMEYALKFKNSQDVSVFWIHASTTARFLSAYRKIAKKVNIIGYENANTGGPQLVREWFESKDSGRWVMVIDNVDDYELLYGPDRLDDYIPRSENGSIIMTTRDKRVGISFAGASRVLLIEALNTTQAQNLLTSRLIDEIDQGSCSALAEELEGIPLAIIQAAAYMHSNSIDPAGYLELYRESSESPISLLSKDFEDTIRDKESKNPIAATWYLSFEYIERSTPLAGELLKMMSILDSQAIPLSLIDSGVPHQDLMEALGTLQAFCLITTRVSTAIKPKLKQRNYDLHRLVRLAMRNWLKIHDQLTTWTARTLKLVASNYPNVEETRLREMGLWRAYLPHAVAVLSFDGCEKLDDATVPPVFSKQELIGEHADDDIPCAICAASLMMNVAFSFSLSENHSETMNWAIRAHSLRSFVLGGSHTQTIWALILIICACYTLGQTEDAQKLGERAIALIDNSNQPPKLVAWKFEILAVTMVEHGRLQGVEETLNKALEIRKIAYGLEHLEYLRTLGNVVVVHIEKARYSEAEKILKNVIEILLRTEGSEDPNTLDAMSLLAVVYYSMGRVNEATAMNAEVSTLRLNSLGARHPLTIRALASTAAIHYGQGRYAQAIEMGSQALQLSTEVNGPEAVDTIAMKLLLGRVYQKQERYDEAERLSVQALDLSIKLKGYGYAPSTVNGYSSTTSIMRDLASLYEHQEMWEKAVPLREKSLEIAIERLGEQSVEGALSKCELGITYSGQGLHENIAEYRYDALPFPLQGLEVGIPETIHRMATIAIGWADDEYLLDSEKLARDAVKLVRDLEPTRTTTNHALTALASTCSGLNQTNEAEDLFREVLGRKDFWHREGHEDLPRSMTGLALVLIKKMQYTEAESIALQAKDILSNLADTDTPAIAFNTSTLAIIYAFQGRHREAETILSDLLAQVLETWKPESANKSAIFNLVKSLENIAFVWDREEHYSKAEGIYTKTIPIRMKLQRARSIHPFNIKAFNNISINSYGRFEEALKLGIECQEKFQALGLETPPAQVTRSIIDKEVAVSYAGLGRYEDAERFAREALASSTSNVREKNLHSLDCAAVLAGILREQGNEKITEAEGLEGMVIDSWKEAVGEKHLRTIGAMRELSKTYRKQGRVEEATVLEEKAEHLRTGLDLGLEEREKREVEARVADAFERLVTAASNKF
ncbi:MAG: hypothetical protein M1818_002493 [Claussenomyces sp. TS43310]|nr:MAG: hypothetical protein M1818_002493 [Claussenomyces sp. TS43310]